MEGIMAQYVQIGYCVVSHKEVAWQYANNTIDFVIGHVEHT